MPKHSRIKTDILVIHNILIILPTSTRLKKKKNIPANPRQPPPSQKTQMLQREFLLDVMALWNLDAAPVYGHSSGGSSSPVPLSYSLMPFLNKKYQQQIRAGTS